MTEEPKKHPGGRPTDYRPEYCEMVFADMAKGYSLGAFAGLIGVARSTINVWMAQYPEFSEAVSRGKAKRLRQWETAGMQSAFTQEGGNPGMIQFGLKNAGREDWVDEKNVSLRGSLGHYDLSNLTDEQVQRLAEAEAILEGVAIATRHGQGRTGEAGS